MALTESREVFQVVGVRDAEQVRVLSQYGTAVLPARIDATVAVGQLFATFHTPQVFLNALTQSASR
jgi:formate dehydrogenase major subunit